jgi:Tripartite tricarboxylate transporter family receptor
VVRGPWTSGPPRTTPCARIARGSTSPYRTLADLIDAAHAKPGELSHASVGPATTQHIAFELLKLLAKVNMTYVPFNGNGPALNALLGGHVTAVMSNYAEAAENISAGKLRAVAVGSRARIDSLPNVPTVSESGYKDYEVNVWYGLRPKRRSKPWTSFRNGAMPPCWRPSSSPSGPCRASIRSASRRPTSHPICASNPRSMSG